MATPAQAAMHIWTEHRNPEGRTYWFNTGTRESVWEKPDDLKTPFERALNQTKWKEYFSGGRKYYYNTETKESKWDMPDELLLVLEKVEKEGPVGQPAPSALTPALITGSGVPGPNDQSSASQTNQHNGTVGPHTGGLPFAPTSILPARPNLPDDPVIPHNGFATAEEGEKAFTHLLRKAGVDANWTWDQTMRAIITDPLYKALNTLAEKKAAWQKFTDGLKAKEHEEREARLAKYRPAIRNMLKGNPNVFHYTTFATADKLFAQHPIWQQAKIEAERRLIFEEYVAELKQREVQETRAARSRSISKVVSLFKKLDVDVVTRWRTAHTLVLESEEWNQDPELRKLPTLDILLAFEDYSRVREREYEEQMRRSQVEKTRKERKAREAFRELLQWFVNSGQIKARTKWKDIYPSFKEDERYLNMLGNPGSNPLELFWDTVDALDQKLDAKIAVVEDAIRKYNEVTLKKEDGAEEHDDAMKVDVKAFDIGPDTVETVFLSIVKPNLASTSKTTLSDDDLHLVFETLHEQALKKQSDEKRRSERKQRHLQDDLRYALKKLPEPLDINMSYEMAVPLIENLPEYKAIEDEEGRRAAFSKFVKRQKERLRETAASEDGGSTTSRKRKEPTRDKERERVVEKEREREPHRERGKEYERDRENRSSRHYHRERERGHDEYDVQGHRSSREYVREKERDVGEKDYRSSKHHREREADKDKDDRRRDRDRKGLTGKDREWEDVPVAVAGAAIVKRDRSESELREGDKDRVKRDAHEDGAFDDRVEKKAKYDRESIVEEPVKEENKPPKSLGRAETPEEGEI